MYGHSTCARTRHHIRKRLVHASYRDRLQCKSRNMEMVPTLIVMVWLFDTLAVIWSRRGEGSKVKLKHSRLDG